jgi:hypothetical protein
LGNNVNQYNEIDAVLLAGFAVKSVVPVRVNISYEDFSVWRENSAHVARAGSKVDDIT